MNEVKILHFTGKTNMNAPDGDFLIEIEENGQRHKLGRLCETDSATAGYLAGLLELSGKFKAVLHSSKETAEGVPALSDDQASELASGGTSGHIRIPTGTELWGS